MTKSEAKTTQSDDSSKLASDPNLTYSAALEELETLLEQLEVVDIDVDHLAERVARGAELVRFCRARLDVVTNDVQSMVSELWTPDPQSESNEAYDEASDVDNDDNALDSR